MIEEHLFLIFLLVINMVHNKVYYAKQKIMGSFFYNNNYLVFLAFQEIDLYVKFVIINTKTRNFVQIYFC